MTTTAHLQDRFGPLMHARDIQQTLRFSTSESFRAARHRGYLKLKMFPMPGRRGLFARTEEVAGLIDSASCHEEENVM